MVAAPGPNFSVQDVYVGWCEGLRDAGAQVARFNLEERLAFYSHALLELPGKDWPVRAFDDEAAAQLALDGLASACYRFAPHVVVLISAFFVPLQMLDLLRARGSRVVVVHTEEPYELGRELQVAAHADLNLINDPTHLESFAAVAPSAYQPHCYRPKIHHPAVGASLPEHRSDVVFAGTGYPSRVGFLEQVDWSGLDLALAGNWEILHEASPLRKYLAHDIACCADNADVADLYRGSKASFNLYRREAERPELSAGWAMGPREVELAACGLFFAREPRGEGDELLPMLPTFDSPAELTEMLTWWLARDEQRQQAADAARAALADRTFTAAAAGLLSRLDG